MNALYSRKFPSPVGELTLVAGDAGLVAVTWEKDRAGRVPLSEVTPDAEHSVLAETAKQLDEYFAGERMVFDLPLDPTGTEFQRAVWMALRKIPFGETKSYLEIAIEVGSRNHTRAVGAANGRNPISIIVPCHRVIGSSGTLTGFAGGLAAKQFLLEHEGRDRLLFR